MAIKLFKKSSINDRYKLFLLVVSSTHNLKLSKTEIDIMDQFYWLSSGVITSQARKSIMESRNITEFNLNNILYKLRKRKILVTTDGSKEQITSLLIPDLEVNNNTLIVALYMQL